MFEREYEPESYCIEAVGPDDAAAVLGVKWLIEYAQKCGLEAGIFVATLQQVDHFARFLGRNGAEALRRHRRITVENVSVMLLTERNLPYSFAGPVLSMWADDEQLERIEAMEPPAICAIPWQTDDLLNWKLARSPRDLRTGVAAGPALAANLVLSAAVRALTHSVNVGSGLADPSDKASAIDLFRTLKSAGEPFTGREVRALANRLGWKGEDARELGELADKISAGRQVRSREPLGHRWGPSSLERWRKGGA